MNNMLILERSLAQRTHQISPEVEMTREQIIGLKVRNMTTWGEAL